MDENSKKENKVKKGTLGDAVTIVYLTPENSTFARRNEFLTLSADIPKPDDTADEDKSGADKTDDETDNGETADKPADKTETDKPEDGDKTAAGKPEDGDGRSFWPRIYLHRAFPFDKPFEYISVLDKDMKELGLISSIDDFPPETARMLREELERKYYAPVIKTIHSVNERFGFSYWKVTTDEGDLSFTLQDTYRSILKAGGGRVFIVDMDGNRFDIPNVEELDFKSYKKIELYL